MSPVLLAALNLLGDDEFGAMTRFVQASGDQYALLARRTPASQTVQHDRQEVLAGLRRGAILRCGGGQAVDQEKEVRRVDIRADVAGDLRALQ